MTATYALQMLLEHGPLTHKELVEITGWPTKRIHRTLEQLIGWKSVIRTGKPRAYVYSLA